MLDKDKLFLILYFGVKDTPMTLKVNQVMYGLYKNIRSSVDDSIKVFIIPERTNDQVKFEFLNVQNVSDEKIQELTEVCNKFIDQIK